MGAAGSPAEERQVLTGAAADQLAKDISEDREAAAVEIRRVDDLIEEALNLEDEIAKREEALKSVKKKLATIMDVDLPNALRAAGTTAGGAHGARVELGIRVNGSLSKAPDVEAAVAYLEENGLEGGVRTKVTFDFPADKIEDARDLSKGILEERKLSSEIEYSINAQTLMAFVRRKLEADPTFDAARVGITTFVHSKFTKRPERT